MKKILLLVLFALFTFPFGACSDTTDTAGNVDSQQISTTQTISVGNKITTDSMEITINSVELTYDVLPDDTSGFYTHYQADAGEVYISVDVSVLNKAKQNLDCDEIGTIVADYNGGYTYRGFIVVKDSNLGFTYANITSIDPLETKGLKWLIKCPEEVEESTAPLFLELKIEGKKYKLVIR